MGTVGIFLMLGALIAGVVVVGLIVAFIIAVTKKKPHPADLRSESRREIRPVTEAVEKLERLVAQNKDKPEVSVIGVQAVEAAKKVREECIKWGAARDELASIARKEGPGGRAHQIVKQIDEKIGEAAEAVSAMVTRIAERSVSEYDIPQEGSLNELVNRLESLGQSMDEVNESLDVRVR